MNQSRLPVIALLVATFAGNSAFAATPVSQLPTAGCYQVDWSATNTTTMNGQISTVQTATIDGATGDYKLTRTAANGQSIVSQVLGSGPFLRTYEPNRGVTAPNCPTVSRNNGDGAFDIKMACETFWMDPARLTFTKRAASTSIWEVTLNSVMTSQVGLNNLPAAMSEVTSGLGAVYANATPRTKAERRQVAQAREGLARYREQARANAPAMEAQRRELEARLRTATPEEQVGLRMALDGPVTTQTTKVVEIWTPSRWPCITDTAS